MKEEKAEKQVPAAPRRPSVVTEKKQVEVETENYVAIFTSEDVRLKHFRLKKYKDRVEESPITIKVLGLVHSLIGKQEERGIQKACAARSGQYG